MGMTNKEGWNRYSTVEYSTRLSRSTLSRSTLSLSTLSRSTLSLSTLSSRPKGSSQAAVLRFAVQPIRWLKTASLIRKKLYFCKK